MSGMLEATKKKEIGVEKTAFTDTNHTRNLSFAFAVNSKAEADFLKPRCGLKACSCDALLFSHNHTSAALLVGPGEEREAVCVCVCVWLLGAH